MVKTKIAVLVSGGGTNLQALLDAKRAGEIPCGEICLVVSHNPNAYALERARQAGVEAVVLRLPAGAEFESALEALLKERGIELIVLAGFLRILSENFTKKWPRRIINIHPALIPSFCGTGYYGLAVHEAALERGVKLTGATVHFASEIPDGGEIIAQQAVPVLPGDSPQTLQRRVMEQAEWILLPRAVAQVAEEIAGEMGGNKNV